MQLHPFITGRIISPAWRRRRRCRSASGLRVRTRSTLPLCSGGPGPRLRACARTHAHGIVQTCDCAAAMWPPTHAGSEIEHVARLRTHARGIVQTCYYVCLRNSNAANHACCFRTRARYATRPWRCLLVTHNMQSWWSEVRRNDDDGDAYNALNVAWCVPYIFLLILYFIIYFI